MDTFTHSGLNSPHLSCCTFIERGISGTSSGQVPTSEVQKQDPTGKMRIQFLGYEPCSVTTSPYYPRTQRVWTTVQFTLLLVLFVFILPHADISTILYAIVNSTAVTQKNNRLIWKIEILFDGKCNVIVTTRILTGARLKLANPKDQSRVSSWFLCSGLCVHFALCAP